MIEKLDNNELTRGHMLELCEANLQMLSKSSLLRMQKLAKAGCNHDCNNCEHCSTNSTREEVVGTLEDTQKESLYKLINYNQIGADTIHNLIVSGSVTVREFQKNVDPVIFEDIWKRVVNLYASLYREDIRPLLLYIKEMHHFAKPQDAVDFLLLKQDSLAKALALETCGKYAEDKLLRE